MRNAGGVIQARVRERQVQFVSIYEWLVSEPRHSVKQCLSD